MKSHRALGGGAKPAARNSVETSVETSAAPPARQRALSLPAAPESAPMLGLAEDRIHALLGGADRWEELVARVGRSTGVGLADVEVTATDEGGPPAYVEGGAIFLGKDFSGLAPKKKENVLMHELAHVAQERAPQGGQGAGVDPEAEANRVVDAADSGEKVRPSGRLSAEPHSYTQTTTATTLTQAVASGWLVKGMRSNNVTLLQQVLISLGYTLSSATGYFGDQTYSAVVAFQKAKGLKQDGQVGPVTAAALDAAKSGAAAATSSSSASSSGSTSTSIAALVSTGGWIVKGNRGTAVTTLQTVLKTLGYYTKTVDGDFGSFTYAAVVSFQKAKGLEADGKVGPATAAALDRANGVSTSTSTSTSTSASTSTTASTSSSTSTLSSRAQAARASVLAVLKLADDHSRYDQVYNDTQGGEQLKDYIAENSSASDYKKESVTTSSGDKALYPSINTTTGQESGLGMEYALQFIDSGGYDELTSSQQDMFDRGIQQVGSFYGGSAGQQNISNGFTWTPSGVGSSDMWNGLIKQSDDNVGKWECSSLACYVKGTSRSDTASLLPKASEVNWTSLDTSQLSTLVPTGSILVKTGHCVVVLGHIGSSLLIEEAQGSNEFVRLETWSLSKAASGGYKLLKP